MSISRLSYTCDHGEAVSDCSRCLRADLAKAQAEVAELRAQLADAEKALEAARALENHEDTCARYVGAVGYDACDCLLGPLIAARDAYDSKWRAGK